MKDYLNDYLVFCLICGFLALPAMVLQIYGFGPVAGAYLLQGVLSLIGLGLMWLFTELESPLLLLLTTLGVIGNTLELYGEAFDLLNSSGAL